MAQMTLYKDSGLVSSRRYIDTKNNIESFFLDTLLLCEVYEIIHFELRL